MSQDFSPEEQKPGSDVNQENFSQENFQEGAAQEPQGYQQGGDAGQYYANQQYGQQPNYGYDQYGNPLQPQQGYAEQGNYQYPPSNNEPTVAIGQYGDPYAQQSQGYQGYYPENGQYAQQGYYQQGYYGNQPQQGYYGNGQQSQQGFDPAVSQQAQQIAQHIGNVSASAQSFFGKSWKAFQHVLSGAPEKALEIAESSKNFGLIAAGVMSVLFGFAFANQRWRASDAADSALSEVFGGYTYFSFNFGTWLVTLITAAICFFIIAMLRPLTVKWVFGLRQRSADFRSILSLSSVSYLLSGAVLAITGILWLIPNGATFALGLIFFALAMPFTMFVAELLIFSTMSQKGNFDKSPIIPHALFTGLWMIFVALTVAFELWFVFEMMS